MHHLGELALLGSGISPSRAQSKSWLGYGTSSDECPSIAFSNTHKYPITNTSAKKFCKIPGTGVPKM